MNIDTTRAAGIEHTAAIYYRDALIRAANQRMVSSALLQPVELLHQHRCADQSELTYQVQRNRRVCVVLHALLEILHEVRAVRRLVQAPKQRAHELPIRSAGGVA